MAVGLTGLRVGRCYLCATEGTVMPVARESDGKAFTLCGHCALVEQRRRAHGATTLLTAASEAKVDEDGAG